MLIVRNANSSQFFLGSSSSSFNDVNGKICLCSVLFGPFGPDSGAAIEFRGRIETGKANRFGERECHHSNWIGDLTVFSGIDWVVDSAYRNGGYFKPFGSTARIGYLAAPDDLIISELIPIAAGVTRCFKAMVRDQTIFVSTWQSNNTYQSATAYTHFAGFNDLRYWRGNVGRKLTYDEWLLYFKAASPSTVYNAAAIPVSGAVLTREQIYANLQLQKNLVLNPLMDGIQTAPFEWGKMAQQAVEAISFADTNGLQYFPELLLLKKMTVGILETDVRSPKALASAFLAWKYGIESSFRDSKLYAQGVNRFLRSRTGEHLPWRVVRSGYRDSVSTSQGSLKLEKHYKIFYRYYDDAILNGYRFLREWGLAPTLTAAWDAIPLSFVVDWFVNVGSFLEAIDYRPQRAVYKVLGVTKSEKKTLTLDPSCTDLGMLWVGHLAYQTYSRTVQRKADEPHFAYESPQDFHNFVESAALIIQRL